MDDERVQEPVARLGERVLARLPELARQMGAAYQAEVPEYEALSQEVMGGDVVAMSRDIVDAFFSALVGQRSPDPADVAGVEQAGRARLELGVPLEAMLHVFRIAGRVVFDAVVDAVQPGEEVALGYIGTRWMDFVDRVSSRAANGYLQASHDRIRRLEARREALVQALLVADGPADVATVAAEFSVSLAPAYAPVLAGIVHVATPLGPVLAGDLPGALVGFRGGVVVVLVPGGAPGPATLERLFGAGPVAWGEAAPAGPALRTEVDHAERVLGAARARGSSGVFGPGDLLVDQLVGGDPRVARALQDRVLAPLRDHDAGGVLVSTLSAFLATGSVPETARRQIVHPNTVAYRLRRVSELTGYDPRVPAEAAVLVLALVPHPP